MVIIGDNIKHTYLLIVLLVDIKLMMNINLKIFQGMYRMFNEQCSSTANGRILEQVITLKTPLQTVKSIVLIA